MFGVLKLGKLGASMRRAGFNPSTLFAASEPGAWYDPSDMSTMFQDRAGTTPVTAVEQPVGLLLDKSKGLVRGAELHTAMQNASTWPFADFSAAGTGFSGSGAVVSGIGAAVGANTFSVVAGSSYEVMVDVASKTSHAFQLGLSTGTQGAEGVISTRASITSIGVTSLVLTALSSGVVRLEFNNGGGGSGASIVVTSISIRELPGNHATQATTTKRPVLKIDAGGCYYLSFDGVDDALKTGNIDFTSTDKMTVWAGVTKLSDAAFGGIVELSENTDERPAGFAFSASGNPGFYLQTGAPPDRTYGSITTPASPYSAVLSAKFDRALSTADESQLRVNGGSAISVPFLDGLSATGSFGNYPLYIGARAGTSFFFNGRLYGLIVRGAQSSLSQIEATELYMKKKVGIA